MWRRTVTGTSAAAAVWALGAGLAEAHGFSWMPSWPPAFGLAVPVSEVNSAVADGCPIESADGLSLFIASARPVPPSGWTDGNNIWVADRSSIVAAWGAPQVIPSPISVQGALDFCPTPVRGRSLMFVSDRSGAGTCGGGAGGDMYISRQSPAGGWSEPTHLGCAPDGPNTGGGERSPALVETPYGTFLFYSTNGTTGHQDIHVSVMRKDGTFGPGKVIDALSSPGEDLMPNVRERELGGYEMVFSSNRGNAAATDQDVYISFAWFLPGPWTAPVKLGSNVNTVGGVEQRATLSHDGKRLYFGRSGDIFVSARK
jgi:hypothetical protein